MSRIGKKVIALPANVKVTVEAGNFVTVEGPKGKLSFKFNSEMQINVSSTEVSVVRPDDSKINRTNHGTTRAILHNMVVGVSEGFTKKLEINGVGYRANVQGNKLIVNAGYSNPVEMVIPEGIKVECPKPVEINISGADKQAVGEFAAKVRAVRGPEPYKGKGIKYSTETIRRKEGKTAKK